MRNKKPFLTDKAVSYSIFGVGIAVASGLNTDYGLIYSVAKLLIGLGMIVTGARGLT